MSEIDDLPGEKANLTVKVEDGKVVIEITVSDEESYEIPMSPPQAIELGRVLHSSAMKCHTDELP
jgi:hypothetical protein